MTSTLAVPAGSDQLADKAEGGLDVDWLIHKKDAHTSLKRSKSASEPSRPPPKKTAEVKSKSNAQASNAPPIAAPTEESTDLSSKSQEKPTTNGTSQQQVPAIKEPKANGSHSQTTTKPATPQKASPADENKSSRLSLKKDGRRSSWLSSLGSKFSSSGGDKSSRSNSITSNSSRKSPQPSPALEKGNPFEAQKTGQEDADAEEKPVHVGPRRPSVLVAAGTETKLDHHPGFLSALRRLSSGNTATLGKAAGSGNATIPRRVLNIDQNRQRTKITDLDQNKLRRVAFKVDVEIAGIAAQADEQHDHAPATSKGAAPPSSSDSEKVKIKDRSEGAALKKSTTDEGKPESDPTPKNESQAVAHEEQKKEEVKQKVEKEVQKADLQLEGKPLDPDQPTTTRKKEKKKRSEAERKERKEKKRRNAEANGLIPLELRMDDDSDSSASHTPPGASTPKKGQPTTDPLRIYKRCCQLREATALATVKEQISKPSATLAEAPGTVASIDLSGAEMSLTDIQTLGDWLAVVPVRRLILDDCNLSDESVRIILSGLSGCKTQEQARANRRLPRNASGQSGVEQMGVIERLSLKNNSAISAIGWRHIALFIHLCQSLRAIDLSGIPFPANASGDLSRTSTTSTSLGSSQELPPKNTDLSQLFARALAERFGTRLEELILSGCDLSSYAVAEIIDSVVKCKIKRLGLASNNLDSDGISHVVRYVTSGFCEGLDLGGNDLNGSGHLITQVLAENNPLFAMSLADCNLTVDDLRAILQHLSLLHNFKFIDLSRNPALFDGSKDVVSLLRRRLPQMRDLKRIHLSDVNMTPTQIISLAEIFPDCPALAHVSILDNQKLVDCMNSDQGEAQEEACAVFVSLMTAVRASKTLVAVEIEVPSQESSEVIKALASQVVAYSLRNLERTTLSDIGVQDQVVSGKLDKHAPEVLLHLVGHMEGYTENHDNDEPAPDEDYMIASTGIVKALGVCLGNKEASRMQSRNISPAASGTATPRSGPVRPSGSKKPKDVSFELCESARKIRLRLRPAMVKEDRAGNMDGYRRLLYLDQTLERTIKRFEDEYPESRPKQSPSMLSLDSQNSSYQETAAGPLFRLISPEESEQLPHNEAEPDPYSLNLSRTQSGTSLAARALTQEEGRMHRFGQHMRREVLKPTGTDDVLHGTSVDDAPEAAHLSALRQKLEGYSGEYIRQQVQEKGADDLITELGINAQELRMLEREDPEAFAIMKDSQLAAQINAGMR
ncbi:Microtubules assembly and stabilization protein [Knufia obscura]|uniref:Microtubules assembly and stabilization protein n=1 Tax=Knufia obscura TaxID=1635080 RepID=A0ABR0RVJ3_9EURO|nr:Microtubules assembly and stabilization protein [Knufia obscura]